MKKLTLIMMMSINLVGCSQEQKSNNSKIEKSNNMNFDQYIPSESKNIDRNNYAEKVLESIKHYDKEPIYYFRIAKQNCVVEISINDVNIYKDYELNNVITPIKIGNILKSGQQIMTVKMYPVRNLINEDLGLEHQPLATKLSDKAKVEIEIIMIDNKSKKSFDDEKSIIKKVSPTEATGKEYFEFNFTFDANVPYEFEGWTKGQDLTKLDQELVQRKALEYYQMTGKIFLNEDLNTWLKIQYPLEKRIGGTFYRDKDYLDKLVEDFSQNVIDKYTLLPVQNYQMNFMGNGKLIRLTTTVLDEDLRGYGALMLKYGEDGNIYQPGITLYLPEGRDLATQGFMMWK